MKQKNPVIPQRRIDKSIALLITILMAIGTVMVFSAGESLTRQLDWRRFYESQTLRQVMFFPLAIIIMHLASLVPYRWFSLERGLLRSLSVWMVAISLVLLTLALIPSIGIERNNARRWLEIPLGPMSTRFQPSEIAKWAAIFFLAAYMARFEGQMKLFGRRFLPAAVVIVAIVGLIVLEDVGTAAMIVMLAFFMLLIGGASVWQLLSPLPVLAGGFVYVLMNSPARMARITAFLNPQQNLDGVGYQANQSLIAIANGGLWGQGLGFGISKYGHLPEDTTDFIFAIIGEELGFAGTASVILLFMLFVWMGMLVVVRCRDSFGRLLAAGIMLAIAAQAVMNIGVVTVVLPTKGITLPFISAGGTSMLVSAAAVGVLLNVARTTAGQDLLEAGS